jgi:hypothetical protein
LSSPLNYIKLVANDANFTLDQDYSVTNISVDNNTTNEEITTEDNTTEVD